MTYQDDRTDWMTGNLAIAITSIVVALGFLSIAIWCFRSRRWLPATLLVIFAAPLLFFAIFQTPVSVTMDVSYDTTPPANAVGDEHIGPPSEQQGNEKAQPTEHPAPVEATVPPQ